MPTQDVIVLARNRRSSKLGALSQSPTSRRGEPERATTASALAGARASLCLCHERDRQLVGLADDSLGDDGWMVSAPQRRVDVFRGVWTGLDPRQLGGSVGFGVRAACCAVDAGVAHRRHVRPAVRHGRVWLGRVVGVLGCSASWTWSRSAGGGWWIAIGLSEAGQFLGRRRAGRGGSTRCWPAACRCGGTADAAGGLRSPWGRVALARPGSGVRAERTMVDPVSLIASAWPSRMRCCDGGLRRIPLRPDWPSSLATSTS